MAADNFVELTGQASRLNSKSRLFVDSLRNLIESGDELEQILTQANLDGASALAAYLGLTGANAADDASRLLTLVSSVMANLNDVSKNPFIPQLLAQFG